ncbi:MAG: hypothetical protein MUE66_02765 [Acidimicrobiia bacterium]|nr:hypothetical protein [Acidimicrobiia bacterium]
MRCLIDAGLQRLIESEPNLDVKPLVGGAPRLRLPIRTAPVPVALGIVLV